MISEVSRELILIAPRLSCVECKSIFSYGTYECTLLDSGLGTQDREAC